MEKQLELMIAIGQDGAIGYKGKMPWRAPLDMKRFSTMTKGHGVILGRITYEEGLGAKPLPGRDHFVLSAQNGWKSAGSNVFECSSEDNLLMRIATYPSDRKLFLIGGAQIYRLLMHRVKKIHVSWIFGEHKADTHFDLIKEVGGLDRLKLVNQEFNVEHLYQEFDVID
jgi:dihydrofolate reductase